MSRETEKTSHSRRAFLKGAAATGGGIAVAAVAPGAALADEPDTGHEKKDVRQTDYRLTEHVIRYYETLMD